jgi:hypothetical protein
MDADSTPSKKHPLDDGRTPVIYRQEDRPQLLGALAFGQAHVFRKTARIIAAQIAGEFTVETDRGPMEGHDGDWLVTNHPEDDPGSDVWVISNERMTATYDEDVP